MEPEDVKVMHFIPGRVRLRVERLKGDRALAQRVRERLATVSAITRVDINTPMSATLSAAPSLMPSPVMATTPRMTAASSMPPVAREMPAEAASSPTGQVRNCSVSMASSDRGRSAGSAFGP